MTIFRAMFSRKWILATLLVLAGTAFCARMGIWQLDRLAQRRAFNEHYLEASMSSPLMLTAAPQDDLSTMEYRLITVTGQYDPAHQVVLRNQFHDNQPGYFLLTPLLLSDGTGIFVERGWIPAEGNTNPSEWHQYDQPGDVTVSGTIRLGASQPELGGVPDPELAAGQTGLDFWNIVNLARISRQVPYKLLPVFVQPEPDATLTAPPYPYQPVIEITEGPHFGYALQWFTFASMLFLGYPFFLRKQLTTRASAADSEE
ncbi:MAG: SURF1 family protein [Chloroflexi bacterium]|nr:SURF1 family protein [Chloroflexota bacterium]